MDLVAGVRKEGSRGGRGDFKWTDVKDSSHRENYLGHSLMAPVGRWQKGRDLTWYAKSNDETTEEAADRAKRELEEERRRVKEAEQEALALALGLPVAPKTSNANLTPLGGGDVRKAVQGATEADEQEEGGRGIGFGSYGGPAMDGAEGETLAPVGFDSDTGHRDSLRDRSPRNSRPKRDGSRDRDRHRRRHERRDRHHRHHHHHRRGQDREERDDRREIGRDRHRGRSHREDDDYERSERRKQHRHERRRLSRSRTRSPYREENRRSRDSRREDDRYDHGREKRHPDRYSPSDRRRVQRGGDDSCWPEPRVEEHQPNKQATRDFDRQK